MTDNTTRMKHLVSTLNEAAKAYYQENREIMSNFEYDKLYDELLALEEETGIILSNSPTQRVGFETLYGMIWLRLRKRIWTISVR